MKKKIIVGKTELAFWITLLMISAASTASGQYELSWYTIDGGGGTSSGGSYTLTGTIGQHDTGLSSNDPYVLSAGFWPGNFGCVVNLTDLMFFAGQWLLWSDEHEPFWPADLNQDQTVDIADFAELSYWWHDLCPADWTLK